MSDFTIKDLTKVDFGSWRNAFSCQVVDDPSNGKGIQFPDDWYYWDFQRLLNKQGCQTSSSYKDCMIGSVFYTASRTFWFNEKQNATLFLKTLKQFKEENPKICIARTVFEKTIGTLVKEKYLSEDVAKEFRSSIETHVLFNEFIDETVTLKDPQMALSLADYYKKKDDLQNALYWLVQAQEYLSLKKLKLSDVLNIDEFVKGYTELYLDENLGPEISGALGRSTTLRELHVPQSAKLADNKYAIMRDLQDILTLSKSIEYFTINCCDSFNSKNAILDLTAQKYLVSALEKNKSIKELEIPYTNIGDAGLYRILQALDRNPNTSLTKLFLQECGITDIGAQHLIDFVLIHQNISWAYLGACSVSHELETKLDDIFFDRPDNLLYSP